MDFASTIAGFRKRFVLNAVVVAGLFASPGASGAADERLTVTVVIDVPGQSVAEISQSTVLPIERAFQKVEGVERVRSLAQFGRGIVWTEFAKMTELAAARQLLVDRVAAIRQELPTEAEVVLPPIVSHQAGVILVGLRSQQQSQSVLTGVAETYLRPRLSAIAGVAEVEIRGGGVEQCRIDADLDRLERYKLDVQALVDALAESGLLARENRAEPKVPNADVPSSKDSFTQLRELVVSAGDGRAVRLEDVALVTLGGDQGRGPAAVFEPKADVGRHEAVPAVVMAVRIVPGQDRVEVLRAIDGVLSDAAQSLPAGIETARQVFDSYDDSVFLCFPDGAAVDRTTQAAQRAESILAELPLLTALWRMPGDRGTASTGPDIELLMTFNDGPMPPPRSERRAEVLRRLATIPELLATIGPARLGKWDDPLDAEVAIGVTGSDPAVLDGLAAECRRRLGTIPGVAPVYRAGPNFELKLDVSPEKLKALGITEKGCRTAFLTARRGLVVGKMRAPAGPPVEVLVRLGDRSDPETIRRLKVRNELGELVSLTDAGKLSQVASPAYSYQENGQPTAIVGCGFDRVVSDADIELLKNALSGIDRPAGYTWRIIRGGAKD